MVLLQTNTGHWYNVEYAGPTTRSNGTLFMTRINNSTYTEINRVFGDPKNTEVLIVTYGNPEEEHITETYFGYTTYLGFMIQNDGSIIVTLQKSLEA